MKNNSRPVDSLPQLSQRRARRSRDGSPSALSLLRDGVGAVWRQPVASVTTALVVAVACLVVLTTTGQSAAAERAVVAHIDGTGTRVVIAVDVAGDAHIRADSIVTVTAIEGVTWAFGIGSATDVRLLGSPRDTSIAIRPFFGEIPAQIELVEGRLPRDGEVLVGMNGAETIGLQDGVGTLTDGTTTWPVVGTFSVSGPLASLGSVALSPAALDPAGTVPEVRYVYAMATSVGTVDAVGHALPAVLSAQRPASIKVDSPTGALALREVVTGELGASSRQLMGVVLAVGLILITVTTMGAVATRRRDFGRSRALGATRSTIVVLVLVQTAVSATVGAAVGTGGGLLAVRNLAETVPSWSFTGGVATLTILIAVVGAAPPAVAAAFRDPVRILRVP